MFLTAFRGAHGKRFPPQRGRHIFFWSCPPAKMRCKWSSIVWLFPEILTKAFVPGSTGKVEIGSLSRVHLEQESENWGPVPAPLLWPSLTLVKTVDFLSNLPLTSTLTTFKFAPFKLSSQPLVLDIPSRFLNAVSSIQFQPFKSLYVWPLRCKNWRYFWKQRLRSFKR